MPLAVTVLPEAFAELGVLGVFGDADVVGQRQLGRVVRHDTRPMYRVMEVGQCRRGRRFLLRGTLA